MSDYIVSARKYRPDSFESLIGQDNIARTLKNSILRGQLAHAYLFCGPRGVGKTSAARIFAKTINCSDPGPGMEPCGKCESCVSFNEGRSYCIHELDAASNNGVEDIKALMDQVQIPPQVGRYSVFIIDEVHMLSQSAFNAFLKTLEEPPSHAIFILATTEKHKIIPTILSRCQTYDFNRISVPDIVRNLRSIAEAENISADEESLHVIAHKADGAMRDALTIFDQTVAFCGTDIKYADVIRNLNVLDYEYSFKMTDAFLSKDYASALLTLDEILAKGFNALHFMSAIGSHFRDLLASGTGGMDSLLDVPDSLRTRYKEQAARCSLQFLFDGLSVINQCEGGYRNAVNQRLHIEYALMRLAFLGGLPASAPAAATAASATPAPAPASSPAASATPAPAPASSPAAEPETAPKPATTSEAAPAPSSAPAPKPAAQSAQEATPAPESAPVPSSAPAAKPAAQSAQEAAPAKKKIPGSAAALSFESLIEMDDDLEMVTDKPDNDGGAPELPENSVLAEKWKELAGQMLAQGQPRLSSAMLNSPIEFREENGFKVIDFQLSNEAQKKWIEERKLRSMESDFQQLAGCNRLRINLVLTVAEEKEIVYTPAEKARDLINRNPEVASLVSDFNLDIK